jgi:4-nitrophenyl phosphatase
MRHLADIKHLVIDMDGVLYVGDEPLPCLPEFIAFLRRHLDGFMLATNNSTLSPRQYAAKLERMGVEIAPAEIMTSGTAAAYFLAQQYPAGTRVHVFGEDPVRESMVEQGFVLADDAADVVVATMDRQVTYDKMTRAALLIRRGARFFATNLDPTRPTEEGLVPGTGAMVAAIEVGSGVKPIAIGKPEPTMYQIALAQLGAHPETTAALGDRLDTDILGGERAGLTTILVLSGATTRAEAEAWGPNYVFDDIAALLAAWEREVI